MNKLPEPRPIPIRADRLVRDFVLLAGGDILGKIAGLAAFAYLARALDARAYGGVELAASVAAFFAAVVHFGVGSVGAREVAREPACAAVLAAQIPAARFVLLAMAVPAMWAVSIALRQPPETTQLLFLFSASLLAVPWAQRWLLQGLDMTRWVSLGQALRMIAFALGVVIWIRPGDALWKVGIIEIVAMGVMASYFVGMQLWHVTPIRLDFNWTEMMRLLREGAPIGVSHTIRGFNQFLPVALVAALHGGQELARFGAANRIVVSLYAFVLLYHFNLYPSVARTMGAPRSAFAELSAHSFRVAAWVSVWGAMLVSLLAEPLCRVAFGEDLASAGPILSVSIWLVPMSLLAGHARSALIAYGQQSRELAAEAATAVILMTVGSILTARLGAMGAAIGVLVGVAVAWGVAHRYASQRVGKLPLFRPAILPLFMAALAIGVARWALPESPWIGGALAACVMLGGGVLVEPRLLRDLESLARAVTHGGSEPATTGSVLD